MTEKNDDAPKPGTPEYEKMMAEKFENRTDPNIVDENNNRSDVPNDPDPMPEGGSEKFYNAETGEYDWASHAKELQFKLDQKTKGADDGTPNDDNDDADDDEGAVKNIIEAAGLDEQALASEIMADGDISKDARAALNKVGVTDSLINAYITASKTSAEATQHAALDYAGGEETWNQMSAWAKANLKPDEVKRINGMLASEAWQDGIDILRARMGAAAPNAGEGNLFNGEGERGNGAVQGFQSRAQMTAAMADPRYRTDPAYRAQVARRVKATDASRFYT